MRLPRYAGFHCIEGCHFLQTPMSYDVLLDEGGKNSTRSLYVPHGFQVMNMDIICKVFQLIRCPEHSCFGSLQLHTYPLTDGLQSYLLVHCDRCNTIVARFPKYLNLDEFAAEEENNPIMISHRACEINARSLLALHTTSHSRHDFLLACVLLDLPVPQNMNKRAMQ